MIIACLYIILLSFVIYKLPFFKNDFFGNKKINAVNIVFFVKIFFGFALYWVYTRYYADRSTADIFKYYDDAGVMFSALEKHKYGDYLKMVFGFSNDRPYFDTTYYNQMNHWYRQYDFGTYNDNHTMIRFNAIVMLFAFGSFHVHTVVMCFISLAGLMALYNTFVTYLPSKKKIIFLSIFLIPSVLFWGSGVLKEGILLFALGFLFYSFFNVFVHKKRIIVNTVMLCLSVYLLLINKTYLLIAAGPALTCFLVVDKFKISKPFLTYLGLYALAFFGSIFISATFFESNILETLSLKHRDFIAVSKGGVFLQNGKEFARIAPDKKEFLDTLSKNTFKIKQGSNYMYWKNENLNDTIFVKSSTDTTVYALVWDMPLVGSTIAMEQLQPNYTSLFKTAPSAIYNSLCKPGFMSAKSIFERISGLENTLVLLFLLICTAWCRTGMDKNLFSLCFFVSITILFLIGYTTPVAGAIMRYKVPVMPFILMCGIIIFDITKIKIFSDKHKP